MNNINFRKTETIKVLELTDFNNKVSNWLIKNGFEKKEERNLNQVYQYWHKTLPIHIEPASEKWKNIHFENYRVYIGESFYGKLNQGLTEKSLEQTRFDKSIDYFLEKQQQAFELARKFIAYVNKANYIVG